jgi:hypothetical protein
MPGGAHQPQLGVPQGAPVALAPAPSPRRGYPQIAGETIHKLPTA